MKFFLFNSLLFFFFFNGIIVKLGIVVASSIKRERERENDKFHFLVSMQSVSNDRKEISNRFAMDSFNGYRNA